MVNDGHQLFLHQCALVCCRHFDQQESPDERDTGQLMDALKFSSIEVHNALLRLKTSIETDAFVRKDGELRSKLKDVWQFQVKRTAEEVRLAYQNLTEITSTRHIELPALEME
ncbi:MAG: hypothetical protein KKD74_11825 [Bacteroidetes bacterium]|nr:hypothetical protein [Bacteroidota bacterium]